MDNRVIQVSFSALDPYIEISIPQPIQKEISGKKYIPYGRSNDYPTYLLGCYKECSTLKAIIDGNVNFVLGDEVRFNGEKASDEQMEQLRELVRDYYIFGYGFMQALANPLGDVKDLVRLPAEYVRCDKYHQAFWFSEKWNKGGTQNAFVYPLFSRETTNGVLMLGKGREVYPQPLWSASVKDVEIEKNIEEFHLSELENNFLSSAIVNFNNGVPTDKEKEEIEKNMREKFSGSKNGGRLMLSFNNNVQNRTTIDRLSSDNFDTRYTELAKRSREQIFIAFKAQPILFGLTSETSTGFSTHEFNELFRLYNKVMISPVQDMLKSMFRRVYGAEVLEITPFRL